jgi:hypothetical protein
VADDGLEHAAAFHIVMGVADAVADSGAELFNQGGRLVWLNAGTLVQVNKTVLLEIITKHVATKRW